MTEIETAAERLSYRIKSMNPNDPLLRKFEADASEFLYQRGFDISTRAGCKGAEEWLENAKVEDAFWDDEAINNPVDWYVGEARLDAMMKVVEGCLSSLASS